jgi:hypothetical protein
MIGRSIGATIARSAARCRESAAVVHRHPEPGGDPEPEDGHSHQDPPRLRHSQLAPDVHRGHDPEDDPEADRDPDPAPHRKVHARGRYRCEREEDRHREERDEIVGVGEIGEQAGELPGRAVPLRHPAHGVPRRLRAPGPDPAGEQDVLEIRRLVGDLGRVEPDRPRDRSPGEDPSRHSEGHVPEARPSPVGPPEVEPDHERHPPERHLRERLERGHQLRPEDPE